MPTQPSQPCSPCQERAARKAQIETLYRGQPEETLPAGVPRYARQPEESREKEALLRRNGRAYSVGHQNIYRGAIELLKSSDKGKGPVSVLEVGAGIGFGFELMLKAGILKSYYGVEPDPATFEHLSNVLSGAPVEYSLSPKGWIDAEATRVWEYGFCVEVIEHVPAAQVPRFLAKLRRHITKNLFLSTPDAVASRHGVAPIEEWKKALKHAGWDVVVIDRQWTTLYICSPGGRF